MVLNTKRIQIRDTLLSHLMDSLEIYRSNLNGLIQPLPQNSEYLGARNMNFHVQKIFHRNKLRFIGKRRLFGNLSG